MYVHAGFHGLVYDLLRRCVTGELGADETAAFFSELTTSLVRCTHYTCIVHVPGYVRIIGGAGVSPSSHTTGTNFFMYL